MTRVYWRNAPAGTNSRELVPAPCQLPGTAGLIVGNGEAAASGAENWILMSATPFTPVAPLEGVTESRRSGPAGTLADVLALGLPPWRAAVAGSESADAWVMAIQIPAARISTITPPNAVIRTRSCVNEDNASPSLTRVSCPAGGWRAVSASGQRYRLVLPVGATGWCYTDPHLDRMCTRTSCLRL